MKAIQVTPPDDDQQATTGLLAHGGHRLLPTRLIDMALPSLPPGGALVRMTGCGLCGTDVEKLVQRRVKPGTVLGHEVVGIVTAVDESAPRFAVGQRVVVAHHVPCQSCHYCHNGSPSMCRQFKATNLAPGGFAEWFAVSHAHWQHTTFAIPSHIADREAACIEPLACVIRAVDRLRPTPHQPTAAIIGMGFIGLLAGQTFQQRGYKTLGVDVNPARMALADIAGMVDAFYMPEIHDTLLERFLNEQTPTGHVDVVCLTAVNPKALSLALRLVRDGGQLLVLAGRSGTPDDGEEDSLGLLNTLYHREINVVTSYSPSLQSLQEAAHWVFQRRVRLTPLVTHPLPLEQFEEGVALYLRGEAIKVFYAGPTVTGDEPVAYPSG